VIGAHTLLTISHTLVDGVLGLFFLAMVPVRRIVAARQWRVRLWQLTIAGAVVGFLTGYGLGGGAFLGSEAASSLVVYTGKMATFGEFGALTGTVVVRGLVIGAALMIGPFLARGIVRRVSPAHLCALDRPGVAGRRRGHARRRMDPVRASSAR
jgi:uncharacterized protein